MQTDLKFLSPELGSKYVIQSSLKSFLLIFISTITEVPNKQKYKRKSTNIHVVAIDDDAEHEIDIKMTDHSQL